MNLAVRLPWFRVHIVLLNDPGRLISVHIMHTGLAGGWSGCMVCYELIIVDATDPVYNPVWRQGCYVIGCILYWLHHTCCSGFWVYVLIA